MRRLPVAVLFLSAGTAHFLAADASPCSRPDVEMAVHAERWPDVPAPLPWARLPLQDALIAWVRWARK